jgi:hypothetical protein
VVERHQRAAGDDAGIAVGGFLARIAPVDQGDLGAQALQFQGGGNAHHAGAQDGDAGIQHSPTR